MNRRIKFRAWDNKEKWMVDDMLLSFDGEVFSDDVQPHDTPYKEVELADEGRYEIMQYTGLKDQNGAEIYEGDILQDEEGRYPVEYSYGSFVADGYYDPSQDVPHDFSSEGGNERMQIIGNIYENPELLKEDNQ